MRHLYTFSYIYNIEKRDKFKRSMRVIYWFVGVYWRLVFVSFVFYNYSV